MMVLKDLKIFIKCSFKNGKENLPLLPLIGDWQGVLFSSLELSAEGCRSITTKLFLSLTLSLSLTKGDFSTDRSLLVFFISNERFKSWCFGLLLNRSFSLSDLIRGRW